MPEEITAKQFREMQASGEIVLHDGRLITKVKPSGKANKYGAKKVPRDGIIFDSQLEHDFYYFLKENRIKFRFRDTFELQPGFTFLGKKYQPVTWTPDFYIEDIDIVIDTKGIVTKDAELKIKWFIFHCIQTQCIALKGVWIVHLKSQFMKTLFCINKRIQDIPDLEQEKYLSFHGKKSNGHKRGFGRKKKLKP